MKTLGIGQHKKEKQGSGVGFHEFSLLSIVSVGVCVRVQRDGMGREFET